MLKSVFFSIFTNFAVGLLLTIFFISLREIGALFFRMTTIMALTFMIIALAARPFDGLGYLEFLNFAEMGARSNQKLTYLAFIFSGLSLTLFNLLHPRLHKTLLVAAFTSGLIGVALYSSVMLEAAQVSWFEHLLGAANGVGSSLILGSVLGSMITGHWYLVQHKLSLNPLKSSSALYIFSVLFRILVIGLTVTFYVQSGVRSDLVPTIGSLDFTSLLFIGRIAIGLLVPLVFGLMVWQSAKIRSTQSATGILYATIVLVLIGETFAKYLYYSIGIPL